MNAAADFRQERHELDTILASGILNRAPNLAHLLTYVCAKYFEGNAEQIKEYNIAVEALGRPPDFDQKRDSIVRVEAHRLRKRLREYYEAEGADHAIRIDIPPGQYAPRFQPAQAPLPSLSPEALVSQGDLGIELAIAPDEAQAQAHGQAELEVPALVLGSIDLTSVDLRPTNLIVPVPDRTVDYKIRNAVLGAVLLLAFVSVAVALWRPQEKGTVKTALSPPTASGVIANQLAVRILAGRQNGDYTDRLGRVWWSDRYFQGGTVFESQDHPIFGTREPSIYQSRREGSFTYDIPLPPGVYELRLHFAETLYGENNVAGGGESSRVFNVWINDKEALHEFDVLSEAGPSTADIRTFKDVSPQADGKLHLRFEPFSNPPLLSAIEIVQGTPGKLRPIRMVALDRVYVDKRGCAWEPDGYARGGQLIVRTKPVEGVPDPELYRGERFGNVRYVVPVPPGRYTATLYFAEAWFGPATPAGGGAGNRVFDIFFNGVAMRRGFDVFKEAHGAGRGLTWSAHGLEPDAQGKLNIALTPVRNYACVNAVEILDEAK